MAWMVRFDTLGKHLTLIPRIQINTRPTVCGGGQAISLSRPCPSLGSRRYDKAGARLRIMSGEAANPSLRPTMTRVCGRRVSLAALASAKVEHRYRRAELAPTKRAARGGERQGRSGQADMHGHGGDTGFQSSIIYFEESFDLLSCLFLYHALIAFSSLWLSLIVARWVPCQL